VKYPSSLSALLAAPDCQVARRNKKPSFNERQAQGFTFIGDRRRARVSLQADDIERGTSYPSVIRLKGKCRGQDENHRATGTLSLMIMVRPCR